MIMEAKKPQDLLSVSWGLASWVPSSSSSPKAWEPESQPAKPQFKSQGPKEGVGGDKSENSHL
jgi:hypothetical protein